MAYRKKLKRYFKGKKVSGVPLNYPEDWAYRGHWKEKKIKPGIWKIDFRATKRRKARGYGGFGKGTKGRWKINAIQYITKTGKGKYQTRMKGTKKSLGFKVKKPKRR